MRLVVGLVIVYQILFTDIVNHSLRVRHVESHWLSTKLFVRLVFATAFFLAVLGFIPGLIISISLYHLAESQMFMPMTYGKAANVFFFILSMCFVAGFLAIRKLKDANPADMF